MIENFNKLSQVQKEEVIFEYSKRTGIASNIIEKDIWVCYVLQTIFSDNDLKDKLVFKGGTCLSKAYNVIDRFSEDVDLAIDKNFLNIVDSSTNPKKISHQLIQASRRFVKDFIYPKLLESFKEDLKNKEWSLDILDNDKDTIIFNFPTSSKSTGKYRYIKSNIQIEFKALSDIWPSKLSTIKPYISEMLPEIFTESKVRVIDIKRNFIEKLFILDAITKRPEDRTITQDRFSRHYYDVYSIIKSGLIDDIKESTHIFESVIENRKIFPRTSWVNYDEINSVSDLKLIPSNKKAEAIKEDYKNMQIMFFKQNNPKFEDIIKEISIFSESLKISENSKNISLKL